MQNADSSERRTRIVSRIVATLPDPRGTSFPLGTSVPAFLGSLEDMHCSSVEPGFRRGDHFHSERDEVLLVFHHDGFTLHVDAGAGIEVESRVFPAPPASEQPGLVEIHVPKGCSHALENTGKRAMVVVGLSNGPYDPRRPDSHARALPGAKNTSA